MSRLWFYEVEIHNKFFKKITYKITYFLKNLKEIYKIEFYKKEREDPEDPLF
jgi:hypothetical protein